MWPFKKTLSEKFSKLVKLIMSIDSHFQMTEDTVDSVRLHLPDYKGNQPMDFHIYLLESLLFISFQTKIEGEKISCLNNFHKDTDQQVMFNTAMANNLNKVHQVLNSKYSENNVSYKDGEPRKPDENGNSNIINENINNDNRDLRDNYDFNKSFKKHALTIMILRPGIEFRYFASRNDRNPLWMFVIKEQKSKNEYYPSGAESFIWIMKYYYNREDFCRLLDLLDVQIAHLWAKSMNEPDKLINDIQKYIPQFNLANDPQSVRTSLEWSWIDIHAILHFISYCSESYNRIAVKDREVRSLQECFTIEDLARLFWSESKVIVENKKNSEEGNNIQQQKTIDEPVIKQSWNLLEFVKKFGNMKLVPSSTRINKDTGKETFYPAYCVCVHPTEKNEQGKPKITAVITFSPELGELSATEIVEQKNDLIIVKYESGDYALRHKSKESVSNANELKEISTNNMSTEVTEDDLANAWTDKYGVLYSENRRRLLKAPTNIESYAINDGTEIICDSAFSTNKLDPNGYLIVGGRCGLTTINMPKSIIKIGACAFSGCDISTISIPEKVSEIGISAFASCRNLISVDIPNTVKSIGERAFMGCEKLINCNIPDNLIEIKKGTFYGCRELTSITIPNCVKSIGGGAFDQCVSLQSINIPSNVEDIGNYAFNYCINLTSVSIQYGIVSIGDCAFSSCEKLQSVILPDSIKKIGKYPFSNCDRLNTIIIPVGTKERFVDLLPGWNRKLIEREYKENLIAEVTKRDLESAWEDQQGVLYSTNRKRLLKSNKNLTSCAIGIGTATICNESFKNCSLLKTIIIPNTVIKIGMRAFSGCSSLENILIPKSVTEICDFAFEGCTSLTNITILKPLEIGSNIFANCSKLVSIYNPSWSGRIDLHEYNDLIDRTRDYPFIYSWPIEEFIKLYGEMKIEECVNDNTGEIYNRMVFSNSFGQVYANDKYYWGSKTNFEMMKDYIHFRIGQDSDGNYWFYDKTLNFWLPGMDTPY